MFSKTAEDPLSQPSLQVWQRVGISVAQPLVVRARALKTLRSGSLSKNLRKQADRIVRASGQSYQDILNFLNTLHPRGRGRRGWQESLGLQPVTHPRTGEVAWVCDRHRSAYLARALGTTGAAGHVHP